MARQHPIPAETPADLVAALVPALRGTGVGGVQVIDEPIQGSRHRHLTVIWDRWKGVPQPERGRIILDAYERADPDKPWRVLEVTLALGLTHDEARKLNLKIA